MAPVPKIPSRNHRRNLRNGDEVITRDFAPTLTSVSRKKSVKASYKPDSLKWPVGIAAIPPATTWLYVAVLLVGKILSPG
jgi:hypothetical protein